MSSSLANNILSNMTAFKLCVLLLLCDLVHGNITNSNYAVLPKLYHLDDYDHCMLYEDFFYCSAIIELSNDDNENKSDAWKTIAELIKSPKNYRHDRIHRGICVPETCPTISKDVIRFDNYLIQREISICFTKKYQDLGLKAYVIKLHCQNKEPLYEVDIYDYAYIFLILVILSAIAIGSYYQFYRDVYPREEGTLYKLSSCFAIQRNWNALIKYDNKKSNIFGHFEGTRVLITTMVLMAHTTMSTLGAPIASVKQQEEVTEDPNNMFYLNGALLIQINFLLSGWLLSYIICKSSEKKDSLKISNFIIYFFKRYMRLTGAMVIPLWFLSTWARHVSRGPFWAWTVGEETENCRENWWTNVLYVNNYINCGKMCMAITWYIAADTQLFAVSLIVLYFACKNRKYTLMILLSAAIFGILLPFLVSYVMEHDIILRFYPESAIDLMMTTKQWQVSSIPGHMNIGVYMQGLIFGYVCYKYESCTFKLSKILSLIWIVFCAIVPYCVISVAYFFYNGYQHTRLEGALYDSLGRNLIGFSIGILLLGMTFGNGGAFKRFLSWSPFHILGKLSYSIYISHAVLMRLRMGLVRTPVHMTTETMINRAAGDILISYVVGVIFYLCIETPIKNIQSNFMDNKYVETNKTKPSHNSTDKKES